MAQQFINPDSTVSNSWEVTGGSAGATAHAVCADTAVFSRIRANAQNKVCRFTLSNPIVTVGTTFESIRHIITGFKENTRSGNVEIQVIIENSSNVALYTENHTLTTSTQIINGTWRTTSDGSADWTGSDLSGLRVSINTSPEDPDGTSDAAVGKIQIEVNTVDASSGYGNDVMGVASANIEKVSGVATANVEKVIGV